MVKVHLYGTTIPLIKDNFKKDFFMVKVGLEIILNNISIKDNFLMDKNMEKQSKKQKVKDIQVNFTFIY
jgi:hypothetical protein